MYDLLNDYFGSVFTTENRLNDVLEVKCLFNEDKCHMLNSIEIAWDILIRILRNLKLNKAPGVDEIVLRILIENNVELSEPLLYVFKKSFEVGLVSSD